MASGGWVADLDKKEHKNWVMVGCALNIAKNGISPKIQNEMETWYQSLISSPPLQSLPSCTCAPRAPKCATCVTWESELTRHHMSPRPRICWNNSDRKQWGSPTGAWEIAKVFMPTLGSRRMDVTDAKTIDIGGLLNLLEWCAFINPPLRRTVLSLARDKCRNHWAHAPKQELQDADVPAIFGHLNSLLSDPVFIADKTAQEASKDLQDLFHQGLVNVRISEVEALRLLRQSLATDLTKCQDELNDVRNEVAQLNMEAKKVKELSVLIKEEICRLRTQARDFRMTTEKYFSFLKEQGDLNIEEVYKLRQQLTDVETKLSDDISTILHAVGDFNRLLRERGDLEEAFVVIYDNVKGLRCGMENAVVEIKTAKSQVAKLETNFANMKCEVEEVANEAAANKKMISCLQKDVMVVKEEVETLKGNALQGENDDDGDILCTAPSRLTSFTGRKSALEWLERNVISENPENGQGTSCCTKTICGLGGCGKTSLAVEFAWSYKSRFPGGVFWINGESDKNIRKSVVEILALVDVTASTTENIEDTLNKFLSWMSKKKNRWFLVVDNADELKDTTCPTGVKKMLRGSWQRNGNVVKHGRILFTTRENAKNTRMFLKLSSDHDCLELPCFGEGEGALFLMKRTGCEKESIDPEAIFLAKELGALPLALEQAAAYISASPLPLSFKEYLSKYRATKLRLLKQQPATAMSLEAQHRLSIHTTWEMNFKYVKERSPAAATMMRIAAFLESEYIPIELINPGCPELDQEDLRDTSFLQVDISGILKVMSSYSLFSVHHQRRVFGVHKLVQEVVRDSLTTSERIKALVACIRVLRFALLEFPEFCSKSEKSAKHLKLGSLSELKEEDVHIVVALLLNFLTLTSYMEQETKLPRENYNRALFNDDTLELCKFVYDLTRTSKFLYRISFVMCDFYLEVFTMVRGDSHPNDLLFEMVNTSISKLHNVTNIDDAKKLSEKTVQKLIEFEKSGVIIEADVKYRVHFHRASYLMLECQFENCYKALLKIEGLGLPISDDYTVELQTNIALLEMADFESACNRFMNALELARRVYPWNDPKLLRVLEYLNLFLSKKGKFQEAKIYAEELREIYMSLPRSDKRHEGSKSVYSCLSVLDPEGWERTWLENLKYGSPHIYSCVKDGYVGNCIPFVDDGSVEHVAITLLGLMKCFTAVCKEEGKANISTEKLTMYRRIGEIFVALRKKFYGSIFPDTEEALCFLMRVHMLLGTDDKEVFRCHEQPEVFICQRGVSRQTYQISSCNSKVFRARMHKDLGNTFFNSGDYFRALEFYNEALNLTPNDAKLSTNKAAAYVKLSKRYAQNQSAEEQQKFLECAFQESNKAITADPSWVKGYYWRAVCLAKLGRRGPSLASAAVAKHLFPSECNQIPAVVEMFGGYNVKIVTSVEDLQHATERTENNLVILFKDGRYELPKPLKAPTNAVLVGLDKVQITCTKDISLTLDKTVYIENITLSPTAESITKLKVKAKECLNRDQLSTALSLYSNALTKCPSNPQLLTTRASTYLKSAKQKKDFPSEKKALLELALKDCEVSIKADPCWLLGYSTKALITVELDRKNQALAAAAVFKHLTSGRDIPGVTQRYGELQIHVVESSDKLRCVLRGITELEGVNQVILIKEGEYVLEKSVQIEPPIVVAGLGKVTVSCKTGPPFHFKQEHFVENVELCAVWENQPESQETASSNDNHDQPEVISLAAASGYENAKDNSECKVN